MVWPWKSLELKEMDAQWGQWLGAGDTAVGNTTQKIIARKVPLMLCPLSTQIHCIPERCSSSSRYKWKETLPAWHRMPGWKSTGPFQQQDGCDLRIGIWGLTKRNRRKKTALLVSDYINLSDNGTSFLCLIKIWNSGCDLSFLYYSLPPGSRSQWWHCQNL